MDQRAGLADYFSCFICEIMSSIRVWSCRQKFLVGVSVPVKKLKPDTTEACTTGRDLKGKDDENM